jgi:hypothetical protein
MFGSNSEENAIKIMDNTVIRIIDLFGIDKLKYPDDTDREKKRGSVNIEAKVKSINLL